MLGHRRVQFNVKIKIIIIINFLKIDILTLIHKKIGLWSIFFLETFIYTNRASYPYILKTQFWWKIPSGFFSHSRSPMSFLCRDCQHCSIMCSSASECLLILLYISIPHIINNNHVYNIISAIICTMYSLCAINWSYLSFICSNEQFTFQDTPILLAVHADPTNMTL